MEQQTVSRILQERVSHHVHQEGMEREVVLEELLRVGSGARPVHCLHQRSERGEVLVGRPARGHVGNTALHGLARLEHV